VDVGVCVGVFDGNDTHPEEYKVIIPAGAVQL
jgi:hypothetical protein